MRFMMMIKSDAKSETGAMPDQAILNAMGRFNEEMVNAGVMLGGEGLKPSAKGARVRLAGKKLTVTDGPFAEAKEVVAGYWLIQTKTRQEAIDWARRVPGGEIELRRLYELSDFPADPSETPEGWRAEEQSMREAAAVKPPARQPGTRRYLIMLRSDGNTERGVLPGPALLEKMGALMTEVGKSGAALGGEGLKPTSEGVRVTGPTGKRRVIDGPFTEAKELIAGFVLLQTRSRDEAIDFAKRWLQIHVEGAGLDEGEIEVREVMELDEIPVDASEEAAGWRQREQRLRERLGQ